MVFLNHIKDRSKAKASEEERMANYHSWQVARATKYDPRREEFLEGMGLGPLVQKGIVVRENDDTTLPLYSSNGFNLTVSGFGPKAAKKLNVAKYSPDVVIGGICLWDGRWQAETEEASFKLALKEEHSEACAQGDIERIIVPDGPGIYHLALLKFQKAIWEIICERWKRASILYHFPDIEYSMYILDLPVPNKVKEKLKEELSVFNQQLSELVHSVFPEAEIMNPLEDNTHLVGQLSAEHNIPLPLASFVYPYFKSMKEGKKVAGIEDMVEYSLPSMASGMLKRSGATPPPVIVVFGVLDVPHPFLSTEGPKKVIEV